MTSRRPDLALTIVVLALLVGGVVAFWTTTRDKSHEATARVSFAPGQNADDIDARWDALSTIGEDPLVIADLAGGAAVTSVETFTPGRTSWLDITVTATSPAAAASSANALAVRMVEAEETGTVDRVGAEIDARQDKIDDLQARVDDANAEIDVLRADMVELDEIIAGDDEDEADAARRDRLALQDQIDVIVRSRNALIDNQDGLQREVDRLEVDRNLAGQLTVTSAADIPGEPALPRWLRDGALAFLATLAAGVILWLLTRPDPAAAASAP